jgi:anti-anti-sigma factor
VVRLAGELDLTAADQADSAIRAVETAGAKTIVLDLRELRFMDSTGLRVILAADARARREGWMLSLIPGPESVHRVFRMALLDQRLDFVEPDDVDGGA